MKTSNLKLVLSTLFLVLVISVFAHKDLVTFKGKVIDVNNNPIVGALVKVKNTSISAITDNAGEFYLTGINNGVLIISSAGFETQEVNVKGTSITVVLQKLNATLDALQGKVAGIQIESTEGSPDSQVQIRVRGGASITQSNEPIYIVDGKVVSNVNNISTSKVKSVEVMKDASASSIYGSKGANGVVIINTGDKKGYMNSVNSIPQVQESSIENEEYSTLAENRFKDPKAEALSTFSLDVDAASYSNVRRVINAGQMPDKNSVRVEEMINYFSYNYSQPTDNHPVSINTEVHSCPWNQKHLLVRIGVKAKEIPSDNLPASNFVFLLDVSGSMASPNKLDLVKSSLKLLCNNLRAKDRVAIVVYAGAAGVVLESTPGDDKQKIVESFERLNAGGSTAGGAGIELAYAIAQKNFITGGNNRIILCTDGDFNVGVSSELGLEQLIEAKRKTGIFLTVLGYGMGNYKDNKLQTLAQKGNGNHAYIDNIQEANKVLVNEFGSTMYAVAKDVKLQVEFNPAYVQSYRLVGYESRLLNKEDFNDDTKDAGELGAGHTVTAFYEIIPVGVPNTFGGVDELRYQSEERTGPAPELPKALVGDEMMYVKLRYKPIGSEVSLKMEVPVSDNIKRFVPSDDYLFAAAVAMFAQQLRESDFKGDGSYAKVISLANTALGQDKNGYRREFVRLVEAVNQLAK